jgi:hypothetical protein
MPDTDLDAKPVETFAKVIVPDEQKCAALGR